MFSSLNSLVSAKRVNVTQVITAGRVLLYHAFHMTMNPFYILTCTHAVHTCSYLALGSTATTHTAAKYCEHWVVCANFGFILQHYSTNS